MAVEMFDTLAFSKRLQAGDVPTVQADAHASAQAELVIAYLLRQVATKQDLERMATKADLEGMATKKDLEGMASKADLEGMATKRDLESMASKADLEKMAAAIRKELADLAEKTVTEEKLLLLLDLRDKRMTIRLGGMILAAVVAMSTLMRFMQFSVGG